MFVKSDKSRARAHMAQEANALSHQLRNIHTHTQTLCTCLWCSAGDDDRVPIFSSTPAISRTGSLGAYCRAFRCRRRRRRRRLRPTSQRGCQHRPQEPRAPRRTQIYLAECRVVASSFSSMDDERASARACGQCTLDVV